MQAEERQRREMLRRSGDGLRRGPLEAVLSWARSHSLAVHAFVTGCCSAEVESVAGPRYDLERFGCSSLRTAPRDADLLIVGGTVTRRQAAVVEKLYSEMQEPRWVMAFGSCACSGAPYENHVTLPGIDSLVPVDVYVPGCPPRPEALLDGLIELQARIRLECVGPEGRRNKA